MATELFLQTVGGIAGVNVQVAPLNADAERDGLVPADIRADVESRLKASGIRIFTQVELFSEAPGTPILYLAITTLRLDGVYAYSVGLQLWQAVTLVRDPTVRALAATWSIPPVIGTVQATHLAEVTKAVRSAVDSFIQDYVAANRGR